MGKVFASGRVIPKTLKMVLDIFLTLSNIRYVSRAKWSNRKKRVAPSPTPWCSSYWKGSLRSISSLQRSKPPPRNGCPGYDTKSTNDNQEFWEMWVTPTWPLLPCPHLAGVVVLLWVLSMGQIELINNLLYLKPFNCVQTNELWLLKHITNYLFSNHICVCECVCVCVYKQNLELDNLQKLIYHKILATNISICFFYAC